ncbi:MAG: NADPH-dependent F420 reductase [Acidimicrobiia bacterium]
MDIGVIGATGPAGGGLAVRLASVGHDVVLGSRDSARADAAVAERRARWGERVARLRAGSNAEAAAADLVVLAVPWDAAAATAQRHAGELAGKVVVSMANGLERQGREFRAILPEGRAVAEAVQATVPDSRVVVAFQHVPAAAFDDLDDELESDVIVAGNDDDARLAVLDLVASMPALRGFDAGSLVQALAVEAFAAVLLSINVRYTGRAKAYVALGGVDPGNRR